MIQPNLEFEKSAGFPNAPVIGVDEVGRGCLAGPVVVGALILPQSALSDLQSLGWVAEIRDSKLLIEATRDRLAPLIRDWAEVWALGVASVEEVDRLNILQAVHLAMGRAVGSVLEQQARKSTGQDSLAMHPTAVLVDGNQIPKCFNSLNVSARAIVKGDAKCLSIAAASILAKVHRDRFMVEQSQTYPGYGFEKHKGYSTKVHQEALLKHGVTPLHRRSFGPVARAL